MIFIEKDKKMVWQIEINLYLAVGKLTCFTIHKTDDYGTTKNTCANAVRDSV